MKLIYIIGKLITFPGAYMKGLWEHLTCRIAQLPIEQAGYLNMDERCGHIEHSWSNSLKKNFWLCFLPGFLNFLLGFPLFCASFIQLLYLGMKPTENIWLFLLLIVMLYCGMSLLCNLYPLIEDAVHFWELLYHPSGKQQEKTGVMRTVAKVLLFLPALGFRVGAFLERYAINVLLYLCIIAVGVFWL